MKSIHWIIGYLEGRLSWYTKHAPNETIAIAELDALLNKIKAM